MAVHQLNIEMGDTVVIEVFQSTSIERRNAASVTVETPGMIVVTSERHEEDQDLRIVQIVE